MPAAFLRWSFALILLGSSSWAQAALATYTLQDVVFEDGGTLNGWVTLDPTQATQWDSLNGRVEYRFVTTQGTSSLPPEEYTDENAFVWYYLAPSELASAVINVETGLGHALLIHFYPANAASPAYVTGFENDYSGPFQIQRFFWSYNVSGVGAIPEANTSTMILVGLVLIGAISAKARR
jgi:hypothetical protein